MPPWGELSEISPEGRFAAQTISGMLVLTGASFIAGAWREVWLRCPSGAEECQHRAAVAGLVTIMSVLVLGLGAAIWLHTRRRPVRNGQGSRSSWGLGALFALGLVLVSRQIPAWTCDIGRFDEVLRSCVTVHTRTDPHSAVALKDGLIAFGVLGGTAIAVMPRWVRLSAPVAAIAWMVGAGWLLLDAFVRG